MTYLRFATAMFVLGELLSGCQRHSGPPAPTMANEAFCLSSGEARELKIRPYTNSRLWKLEENSEFCNNDSNETKEWLKILISRGDIRAMTDLGIMLRYEGHLAQAKVILSRASALGNKEATEQLKSLNSDLQEHHPRTSAL
jgi:hypothetical protein